MSHDFSLAPVYRILDAAANRALEGIRVIEDYVRFGLDDHWLTSKVKDIRHELASALQSLSTEQRLVFRNTIDDVGTKIEGKKEYTRNSVEDVLKANFSRFQESLRSLEEYGKVIHPDFSRKIEQIRYQSYTLQKAFFYWSDWSDAATRLQNAKLYVLVDARDSEEEFCRLVRAIVDAGADVIQLRDKNVDDRILFHRGKFLRTLTESTKTLFIMNDRPDLALLTRADGVHLGQEEVPGHDVRMLVGPKMLIGLSTHSKRQAMNATMESVDYIGVGPVFPSQTKSFDSFPGLDLLREVAGKTTLPAFAIGGINENNIGEVLATGFHRVAVQSAITESEHPELTTKLMLKKLESITK